MGTDPKEIEKETKRLAYWLKFNKGVSDMLSGKYGKAGIESGMAQLKGAGFDNILKNIPTIKVQIGKKGIHGFIKIGDESWGYGDKGISYPNEKLYGKGKGNTTYEDTDADPLTVINNINNMTKSGEWEASDYSVRKHNCWDFTEKALGWK